MSRAPSTSSPRLGKQPGHRVDTHQPLAEKRILVTRPLEQAGRLIDLIRAAGGEAVVFPAIQILDPVDPAKLNQQIDRLHTFDWAIFISPTAVQRGMGQVLARRQWPAGLAIAAVGSGSARALEALGFQHVVAPASQSDSEALLAVPVLHQVSGKRIVIFRGEGGRELLAERLRLRGAEVVYAECYRRAKPTTSFAPVIDAHLRTPLSAITITSAEALNNLLDIAGVDIQPVLTGIPFFVPHPRIAEHARQRGIQTVITSTGGDAGLVEGMVKFFSS